MNKKQIIYIILTIIWMVIIFFFSNAPSEDSTGTSKGFVYNVLGAYEKVIDKSIDKESICEKVDYPVRKLAHFTLYFILGFLVFHVFLYSNYNWKYLPTIIVCLMYSISDEIHQLFVFGRSGQIGDVFIDMLGVFLCLLIIYAYTMVKNEKNTINVLLASYFVI